MDNYIVEKNSKIYQRALQREMDVWRNSAERIKSGGKKEANMAKISGPNTVLLRYDNSKIGIESASEYCWVDFITKKFKRVDKALSLGTGSGRYEKAFIERGFVKKFDTFDIIQKNPLDSEINDLNFIDLPGNKYDFILCNSILHHIMNLEHLLFQVNNALKNNGIIVVNEYCGESKFQWSDEKIKILNTKLRNRFGKKYSFLKIQKAPMWNYSPFEGVRSSEIHPIIKEYFSNSTEFEITWAGVVVPVHSHLANVARYETRYYNSFLYNIFILHPRFRQERDLKNNIEIVNEVLEYAVELDKELANSKSLMPGTLFGVYRKSKNIAPIPVRPWTKKELRYQLNLHLPIYLRIKRYFRRFKYLRKFYRFIKKRALLSQNVKSGKFTTI
jgi:SAM-dependent methyltransferase